MPSPEAFHPPLAEQDEALVLDQVRVVEPPEGTVEGLSDRVTVGGLEIVMVCVVQVEFNPGAFWARTWKVYVPGVDQLYEADWTTPELTYVTPAGIQVSAVPSLFQSKP